MSDPREVFDMGILRQIVKKAHEPPDEVRTVHWDDLEFTTLYRLGGGGCQAEFECYQITGAGTGEPGDPRWYGDNTNDPSLPFETEHSPPLGWGDFRVKPYLTGSVKWDGCSNWDFPDLRENNTLLHFCGRRAALAVGVLLDRCYTLAKELMGPETVHDPALFDGHGPVIQIEVSNGDNK
jgi:hypothetical protein